MTLFQPGDLVICTYAGKIVDIATLTLPIPLIENKVYTVFKVTMDSMGDSHGVQLQGDSAFQRLMFSTVRFRLASAHEILAAEKD